MNHIMTESCQNESLQLYDRELRLVSRSSVGINLTSETGEIMREGSPDIRNLEGVQEWIDKTVEVKRRGHVH